MFQVYFGGYFLRNHPVSMHTISFAINYWSRGAVQALFLRHEGYLGAIGAFLLGAEECGMKKHLTWYGIIYWNILDMVWMQENIHIH